MAEALHLRDEGDNNAPGLVVRALLAVARPSCEELFDQSARTRYYSARRKENEPICDFLIGKAKFQYGKGGADASDHVEHYLLNCGDDDIMDLLYPMRLDDIERVEKIINTKILGEKRKRQRDRLSGSRNRDSRRVEPQRRLELTRLTESRRSERRDDRRDDRRDYRRDDRRTRRDDGRDRRVTVAATADDEEEYGMECQSSRRLSQHGYDDMMRVTTAERPTPTWKEGQITITLTPGSLTKSVVGGMVAKTLLGPKRIRPELSGARLDLKGARLSSGTRLINQLIPLADPTGSLIAEILMDAGVPHANDLSMDRVQRVAAKGTQCTSVASATNFVSKRPPGPLRAEQYKFGGPPTMTGLDETGLSQSAEPVAEAKYIFAYVGKAGRPESVWMNGNDRIKMDGIDGELNYSKEESRARIKARSPSSYAGARDGSRKRPTDEDIARYRSEHLSDQRDICSEAAIEAAG
ncbi:unnamed protein product [Phytophthora fragariaefolia]|uniref:Unnamed protein product n=1 Tax=Phytophthora fragariaefolia TaxID=1490495 RepID=A0A9W7D2L1_9STRA|nr:unnamed protein product [Phytophthora fragariaefolia]